jgi:hypothetical protein
MDDLCGRRHAPPGGIVPPLLARPFRGGGLVRDEFVAGEPAWFVRVAFQRPHLLRELAIRRRQRPHALHQVGVACLLRDQLLLLPREQRRLRGQHLPLHHNDPDQFLTARGLQVKHTGSIRKRDPTVNSYDDEYLFSVGGHLYWPPPILTSEPLTARPQW